MNIFVKVKPKAREDNVQKIDDSHYVVHTNQAPEKGKANAGVIRLLAKYFSVPQSKISILSGKTSRNKVVSIHP